MQSFCLSIEGIRKDYLFREKWYVKQGKELDLGAGPPHTKICWVPPPLLPRGVTMKRCKRDWWEHLRYAICWLRAEFGVSRFSLVLSCSASVPVFIPEFMHSFIRLSILLRLFSFKVVLPLLIKKAKNVLWRSLSIFYFLFYSLSVLEGDSDRFF